MQYSKAIGTLMAYEIVNDYQSSRLTVLRCQHWSLMAHTTCSGHHQTKKKTSGR